MVIANQVVLETVEVMIIVILLTIIHHHLAIVIQERETNTAIRDLKSKN